MSFLAPLYIAGLAALSLPLIFHLIRRTPKGKLPFSSLMFLSPSPPRLTRRSRLDDWLLLLLRALALALLAVAFARPFLREAANLGIDGARGRRVAILLDTSASMRRADVWPDAKKEVNRVLDELSAADQVALFTFDTGLVPRVAFDDVNQLPSDRRAALVRDRLQAVTPGWGATNLGGALVSIADTLDAISDREPTQVDAAQQIVLITDLQGGSELKALESYQWPKRVRVEIKTVAPRAPTNAAIQLVAETLAVEKEDKHVRLRVSNQPDSTREQFELRWAGRKDVQDFGDATSVYVPPGESRVVKLKSPPPTAGPADRIVLSGDEHSFDNIVYVVPPAQEEIEILYVGAEASDDVQGLRYYLERAFPETAWRKVRVKSLPPERPLLFDPAGAVRLVVLSDVADADRVDQLQRYLQRGGRVLLALTDANGAQALGALIDDTKVHVTEASANQYAMLGDIDFAHPLFATFADPRFSDFTKIHFWKHRRIEIDDHDSIDVIARFDNGDPALIEQRCGAGRLLVLSSGWHPADSELALSTKFVPLLDAMLKRDGGAEIMLTAYRVNDPINVPAAPADAAAPTVFKPDGAEIRLTSDARRFAATDQPGIYHLAQSGARQPFAVNLAASESQTAPLELGELEQRGVRLGRQLTSAEEVERQRQMRDLELEREQKLWRWLIAIALAVLLIETWLAGRRAAAVRLNPAPAT